MECSIYEQNERRELPKCPSFEGTLEDLAISDGLLKFCKNCKSAEGLELLLNKRAMRCKKITKQNPYKKYPGTSKKQRMFYTVKIY